VRRRPIPQERLSTDVLLDYESTKLPGDRSAVIGTACQAIFRVPASRRKTSVAQGALMTVSSRLRPLSIRRAELSAALGLEAAVDAMRNYGDRTYSGSGLGHWSGPNHTGPAHTCSA
jgi:hypothetical protein